MNVLSITSLVISFLAAISYVPVAKIPGVRQTMWPTWALFMLSAGVAGAAMMLEKVNGIAISTLLLFVFFAISYFLFLRIPRVAGRPKAGEVIPRFQVQAETGQTLSPDDFAGKGPLLLIFFRGFW
jgi:hypothetical protein